MVAEEGATGFEVVAEEGATGFEMVAEEGATGFEMVAEEGATGFEVVAEEGATGFEVVVEEGATGCDVVAAEGSLKSRPGPSGTNVVLRRKENGNWTLRDRSQHNAQRHMQQIFREASSPPSPSPRHPNSDVSSGQGWPEGDGDGGTQTGVNGRRRAHSASQTELHDIKLVLERTGTITPRSPTHHGPPPVTTPHPTPHPAPRGRVVSVPSATVGPVVTAYSEGDSGPGSRQGEASVFVDDHRQDPATPAARAAPATPRPLFGATMGRRQITVPEPATPQGAANGHAFPAPRHLAPQPATMGPTAGPSYGPSNGPTSVTGHSSRKVSLWNGRGAKMAVVSPRHADRQHQFRSLRVSRTSGAPSTVVRSIEDTYARGSTLRRHPVLLVQSRVPHGLQGPMQDVYIAQGALQLPPSGDVYIANPHPHHPHPHHPSPSGDVYIANPHPHHPPPSGDVYIPQGSPRGRPVTPTSFLRRSASPAGSGWVTEDTALTHNGQLDDVLL
ncbi:hypothetical protein ACOMHN_010868 [Nucella lapillus]